MDALVTDQNTLYGTVQEQQEIIKRQKAKTLSYKLGLSNLRQQMMESQLALGVADTKDNDVAYSEANTTSQSKSADVNVLTMIQGQVQADEVVSMQSLLTQKIAEVNIFSIYIY